MKTGCENAGQVLKEIMNIPDDIPQNLTRQSGLRGRHPFGSEGGVYRRRQLRPRRDDLPQRRGFQGPWGAPTMMALEGGSFGFQIGGAGHRFRPAGHEQGRRKLDSQQQSEAGRGRFGRRRTDGTRCGGGHGRGHARRSADVFARARTCLRASRSKAPRCAPTTTPTSESTGRKFREGHRAARGRSRSARREIADLNAQPTQPEEPFEVAFCADLRAGGAASRRAILLPAHSR